MKTAFPTSVEGAPIPQRKAAEPLFRPSLRSGFLLAALLAALLSAAPATAVALDPEDPDPVFVTQGIGPYGVVTVYPGGGGCYDPLFASHSVTYSVDVIPNLGSPKARITIWHWTSGNGSNAVALFQSKVTGPHAVQQTFNGAGYYQLCFKYKLAQAVNPGSGFDFMWIETIANWN